LRLAVLAPFTKGGVFKESLPGFGLFSLVNVVVFMIPEAFREGNTFIGGDEVKEGFPGGIHFLGSACLFSPERCRFFRVEGWSSCKEIRESSEALVGVYGEESW